MNAFLPLSHHPSPPFSSQSCVACSQTTGLDCIAYIPLILQYIRPLISLRMMMIISLMMMMIISLMMMMMMRLMLIITRMKIVEWFTRMWECTFVSPGKSENIVTSAPQHLIMIIMIMKMPFSWPYYAPDNDDDDIFGSPETYFIFVIFSSEILPVIPRPRFSKICFLSLLLGFRSQYEGKNQSNTNEANKASSPLDKTVCSHTFQCLRCPNA